MPWTCRFVESPLGEDKKTPGVLYYAPWLLERGSTFSLEYERDWRGKRPPICLVIPDYGPVCLDRAYYPPQGSHGWTITGEVPRITAHPSLGIGQRNDGKWFYHGWLKDGVLSDDIEGRTFSSTGGGA
jgi:hypothetical protein